MSEVYQFVVFENVNLPDMLNAFLLFERGYKLGVSIKNNGINYLKTCKL